VAGWLSRIAGRGEPPASLPAAGSGLDQVGKGYEEPAGRLSRRGLVFWGGGALVALTLVLMAAQWAPGLPEVWRPITQLRFRQAERMFQRGIAAEEAGDWDTARVAYLSVLATRPEAPAPRWRLGRGLALAGEFDEAMSWLAPVTADPAAFVHDALLSEGAYGDLVRFTLAGLRREPRRRGVWLAPLRLALAQCSEAELREVAPVLDRALASADPEEAAWLAAVRAEAEGSRDDLRAGLGRLERGAGPDAAEVLLGLEMWVRAGLDTEAWVWVQRHRARLGAFDAWFADWRVALARDPGEAAGKLREVAPAVLDPARWHRLAAAAWGARREGVAVALDKLADQGGELPPSVFVSMWVLAMGRSDEVAARKWEERLRRVGGPELPLLLGRALAGEEADARRRASVLLAAQAGLPRELLMAIASDGPRRRRRGVRRDRDRFSAA